MRGKQREDEREHGGVRVRVWGIKQRENGGDEGRLVGDRCEAMTDASARVAICGQCEGRNSKLRVTLSIDYLVFCSGVVGLNRLQRLFLRPFNTN